MQLARVIGTVVATQKHRTFEGAKLLLVQPLTLDDKPRGTALLAVDALGAGVHEKVLMVMEGRAAGEALGRKLAPVDAAVVGIVDTVDVDRMNEDELRALVRAAIARHWVDSQSSPPHLLSVTPRQHPSHGILTVADGSEMDGPCIIEAAVMCNHCGYCKSMGH